jgi:hypothetical protein
MPNLDQFIAPTSEASQYILNEASQVWSAGFGTNVVLRYFGRYFVHD